GTARAHEGAYRRLRRLPRRGGARSDHGLALPGVACLDPDDRGAIVPLLLGIPLSAAKEHDMKVGIIGVGAATAMAIALRARARDLILIDRDHARAKAVAMDMHYGVPLSPLVTITEGGYEDLAGAHLAIIAAGVNEKAGGATDRNDPTGRLRLLA